MSIKIAELYCTSQSNAKTMLQAGVTHTFEGIGTGKFGAWKIRKIHSLLENSSQEKLLPGKLSSKSVAETKKFQTCFQ
jgi:hypothetical protein